LSFFDLKVSKPYFCYIPARVDKAGHEHCWGCKEYYDELKVVDGYIQGIMKALNETKTSEGTVISSSVTPKKWDWEAT
jgi:hypothetical protein